MTIDKAIEILHTDLAKQRPYIPTMVSEAKQLGIEALKRLQNCDIKGNCEYARNLPGETQ